MQCVYCGKSAAYTLKNGKFCCSPYSSQCEVIRTKTSIGLRKAHADGKMRYDQFDGKREWSKGKTVYSDNRLAKEGSRLFCENSTVSTGYLRKVLLAEKLLSYVCEQCSNDGVWCDEPISLELDHKNGDNRDNRLENLRFLCPNCHSQTPTFKGRNIARGRQQVSDEHLLIAIQTEPSLRKALMSVGLTGAGNYGRAYRLLAKELTTSPEICDK